MVVIGGRLGLYKSLATNAMTVAELAKQTATDERYVREWAAVQNLSHAHRTILFAAHMDF